MTGCSRNLESSYERLTVIHYSDGSLGQNCCLWEGLLPSVNVNQFTAIMLVKTEAPVVYGNYHYFSIFLSQVSTTTVSLAKQVDAYFVSKANLS